MKLRKSYFLALAASFVVMCLAAIVALKILSAIPSSAFAEQLRYFQQSNMNPAVYSTQVWRNNAAQATNEDFWVTFPVMFVAGMTLGLVLTSRITFRETIIYSLITAIVLGGLIFGLDVGVTRMVDRALMSSAGYAPAIRIDSRFILNAAISTVLWGLTYMVGAVAGHFIRQRFSRPSVPTNGQRPPKRRVASTTN